MIHTLHYRKIFPGVRRARKATTSQRKTIYEEMEAELEARKRGQGARGTTERAHASGQQIAASPAPQDPEEGAPSSGGTVAQMPGPSAASPVEPAS